MDRCGHADRPVGPPPRQRPHAPSQADRRARQDLRGEGRPQVRAGGRRPRETRGQRSRTGSSRKRDRCRVEAGPRQGYARSLPELAGSPIPSSRNLGIRHRKGTGKRLTPQGGSAIRWSRRRQPPDFNIDRDIPDRANYREKNRCVNMN